MQWDRAAGWAAIAAGGVVLLVGWFGLSGTAFPAEQIPYLMSGGIGGLFLLGVGAVLVLSADLRDEWRKLDALERELSRHGLETEAGEAPSSAQGHEGNGGRPRGRSGAVRTGRPVEAQRT